MDASTIFDNIYDFVFIEQYESFLKFNHDQLRRKFNTEMADCSCKDFSWPAVICAFNCCCSSVFLSV